MSDGDVGPGDAEQTLRIARRSGGLAPGRAEHRHDREGPGRVPGTLIRFAVQAG